MDYQELVVSDPLSRFINKAWCLSYPSVHRREKILPMPVHHFIVNLSSEPYKVVQQGDQSRSWSFERGFISGIQASYLVIENPEVIRNVGIELKPYGLAAFAERAPETYIDKVQTSDQVLPGSTHIADKLKTVEDPQTCMQLLLAFMEEKRRSDYTPPDYLESSLPLLEAMLPIAEVARRVGVSHKQLAYQWKKHCGITAKHYQNIVRLQQVVNWFDKAEKPIRWSTISSELSYYDQAYFIRTFRQLTGFTPKEYARLLSDYPSGTQSFVALDDEYARLK